MKETPADGVPRTTGVVENSFKAAMVELQKGLDALKEFGNPPGNRHTAAGGVGDCDARAHPLWRAHPVDNHHKLDGISVKSTEATQTQEDVFDVPPASCQDNHVHIVQDTTHTKFIARTSTPNRALHPNQPREAQPVRKPDPRLESSPFSQEDRCRTPSGKMSGRLGAGTSALLSPPLLMDTAWEYGTQKSGGTIVGGARMHADSDGSQRVNELMSQSPIAERMRVLSQLVETRIQQTKGARHSQTTTVTVKDHQVDDALKGINQFEWPDS
ncbi:hypothetical protein BSKO_00782 [Bryopsis sp. KO-2023]|nr:hypothetical protein BSKO_00782 [Bryopsis sp. KO-2023]